MRRIAWRADLPASPNSAQAGGRHLLRRLCSRGIFVSVNCGMRLAHRDGGTLHPLDYGRGVRPVSCAADHCGPSIRNIGLVGVAAGLRIPVEEERWAETHHQGIPAGELLWWNPRW